MYYIRKTKRNKLLKKLFNNLIKDLNISHLPIKFRVSQSYASTSYCKYISQFNNDKAIRCIINLNLQFEKELVKNGYTNSYYKGRYNKLNFIIGNYKLAKRFTLLHELKHAIDSITLGYKKEKHIRELEADNFAINYLTKKGLIKQVKPKYIPDWSCD